MLKPGSYFKQPEVPLKANFWEFINCLQSAEGGCEAGGIVDFLCTQDHLDVPQICDIFCFAPRHCSIHICWPKQNETQQNKETCNKSLSTCAPCAFFFRGEHASLRVTEWFLPKRKEKRRETLFSHRPPFLPVRISSKRTPLSPRSSSPPPAVHLPVCNLSFALKAAFCVRVRLTDLPEAWLSPGSVL